MGRPNTSMQRVQRPTNSSRQLGNAMLEPQRGWHPCSKSGMTVTVNHVVSLTPVLVEDFAS